MGRIWGDEPDSRLDVELSHPQPVPWAARDVWLGLGILGLMLVAAIALGFLAQFFSLDLNLGLIISLGELLLLGSALWLALRKYPVGWQTLGLRAFRPEMIGLGCGLMLISFAFNFAYALFLGLFGLRIQVDLVPILAELSSPWLLFLGAVVIAPVVEELFFRGFAFAGLRQTYGWQKAAVISSVLFALIHLTPTAIIPIFILGYIFAYLYQRSNSIWPAILMHAVTNGLALGAAYLSSSIDLPI
jgi:membrane protease YdiL (CAAX protease family)